VPELISATGVGIGPIDGFIVIAYLIVTTLFGVFLGRGQSDNRDFFLDSHRLPAQFNLTFAQLDYIGLKAVNRMNLLRTWAVGAFRINLVFLRSCSSISQPKREIQRPKIWMV
jgi:hypothetical protein